MFTYIIKRIGEHIIGTTLIIIGGVFLKEIAKEGVKSYYKVKIEHDKK